MATAAARTVIDAHVHITSLTNGVVYPWAAPPVPPATCPCAQPTGTPCGCEWTSVDYAAATSNLPASTLVFVEVGASPASWLVEAQWAQGLANAGANIGAIVAGAPPSFCAPDNNYTQIAADLDALAALPLARGIRGSCLNFSDAAGHGARVSRLVLLAARGLSLDVITPVAVPGIAAAVAALGAAVPPATIVLDHVGSPSVKGGAPGVAAWAAALQTIAGGAPNVVVKLGGILQFFKNASGVLPGADETAPFVLGALDAFGFERSLYEGNCEYAAAVAKIPAAWKAHN